MRTRTSTQKRQKEIARMEKQREKAARRQQRKLESKPLSETDLESLVSEANPEESKPAGGNE
jgi:hypothetical protein